MYTFKCISFGCRMWFRTTLANTFLTLLSNQVSLDVDDGMSQEGLMEARKIAAFVQYCLDTYEVL